eukprot:TRINITY_DN54534_c0_g1_i1.p1 TRINITY_DN54534_c0_g1~~TRINITY_DN54534_c0_g1_i1.p1  ORF type:complete len:205 (-),score=47.73 TRINITY_DN54534_c0_g1_i1:35-565(-)
MEVSRFEAYSHGEVSEALLQITQVSEAAAAASSEAKTGQALLRTLRDEETEFREHLAGAVGSLRAEVLDRHAMVEEQIARTQGRLAQELGEQRVQMEGRVCLIEERLDLEDTPAAFQARDARDWTRPSSWREPHVASPGGPGGLSPRSVSPSLSAPLAPSLGSRASKVRWTHQVEQ